MANSRLIGLCLTAALIIIRPVTADDLAKSLVFYASFDSMKADVGSGNRQLQTARSIEQNEVTEGLPGNAAIVDGGLWGKCLRFNEVADEVVLFRGQNNLPYRDESFDMTVSFWLRVDPEKDLKPGYVDPLQITDKKWNDASLFVDFTKDDQPRHFRLGVFSDFRHWNPTGEKWDEIAEQDRPMVVQRKTPFAGDRWTHVVASLSYINSSKPNGSACLYVDGNLVGCLKRDLRLTWNMKDVAVMLGIQYIGEIDDLAIFNRALTKSAVEQLHSLDGGVGTLVQQN